MFTGIIEETGVIESVRKGARSAVLTVRAQKIFDDLKLGDSVATNGVCLTVTAITGNRFTADVMSETLGRTALGTLAVGSRVNLERAMRADGRFGGHIVSGHIDGTGEIVRIQKDDNAVWYTIKTAPSIMHYILEKGSIAVDGISLTVVTCEKDRFQVSVIPHTAGETTLSEKTVGSMVNLENDILGKYAEKLLSTAVGQRGVTKEFLMQNGF